jgi:YggT family protein
MFIIGYFLGALATVLNYALTFYMFIIIARAVLSWVNPDPYNPIVRFIHNVTEPVMYQIRSRLPTVIGGIDLSPIVVLLAVVFLQKFLVNTLLRLSASLV